MQVDEPILDDVPAGQTAHEVPCTRNIPAGHDVGVGDSEDVFDGVFVGDTEDDTESVVVGDADVDVRVWLGVSMKMYVSVFSAAERGMDN